MFIPSYAIRPIRLDELQLMHFVAQRRVKVVATRRARSRSSSTCCCCSSISVGLAPRRQRLVQFVILLLELLLLLLLLLLELKLLLLAEDVGEVGQLDRRGLVDHRRRRRLHIDVLLDRLDEIDAPDVGALEHHLGVLVAQRHAIAKGANNRYLLGGDLLDQALEDAELLVAGY